MAADTITLALEGEVPLEDFATVLAKLRDLVAELSREVSGGSSIDRVIDGLEAGSATMTIRGVADDEGDVERVVRAYQTVGAQIERHEAIPYSRKIEEAARAITRVLDGRITAMRFETPGYQATIISPLDNGTRARRLHAFGAIDGRVETLSEHNRLRFTLYDALTGRAVTCYLREDQRELMRNAWGKRAIVEGWITRDAASGRPLFVDDVTTVQILDDRPAGTYRAARGASLPTPGTPLPEERIRLIRDA